MSVAWIGVAVSVAAVGTSVGMSASGAGQPTQPNLAASSAELANMQAQLLPIQRQLTAAAQQGTSVTVQMPAHIVSQQLAWIPADTSESSLHSLPTAGGQWVPYDPKDWQAGGQYAQFGQPKTKFGKTKVPAGPQTFDFTGYGAAEVQGKLADAMARVQLALSQKYDSQFIDEALKQEKLADPEGFAAREKMNSLIHDQINRPLNEPVADELDRQVQQELTAAKSGTLDPQMHDVLMSGATAAQNDRGGASGTNVPDFEKPLTTGFAGTKRILDAINAGGAELSGGQTPEDIAYRREQQNLANLSDFMSGRTPQSEFKSLSGAQQGPTPFAPGQPLPLMPDNSQGAQSAALNRYGTTLNNAANQTNPWMAGLSAMLGAANAAVKLQ